MVDERKKIIIRSWLLTAIDTLFVVAIVETCYGEFVQAGLLLIALSVVSVFYNGLAFTVFWGLCGLGILLLGYEKRLFALGLLTLAAVIMAADIMLWIRAIKRDGMRGLLRVKITADRPKIDARRDFYKENEVTCILWNKLKKKPVETITTANNVEQASKIGRSMTSDERRRFIKFLLMASIAMILLTVSCVFLLYKNLVWGGILFAAVGVVATFFLPPTNFMILMGLMMVFLGYGKKELALIFGAIGLAIATTNVILMNISIAKGGLEKFRMRTKSNRFAFFDYLRENDITCILWNKLKRRLNREQKNTF